MAYKLEILEFSNYVKIIVSGKRIPGMESMNGANAWVEIGKLCNSKNINRILILSKLKGYLPVLSSYDIARSLPELGIKIGSKIAFVENEKEAFRINSINSVYARNKSVNIRVFDINEDEALEWLLGE